MSTTGPSPSFESPDASPAVPDIGQAAQASGPTEAQRAAAADFARHAAAATKPQPEAPSNVAPNPGDMAPRTAEFQEALEATPISGPPTLEVPVVTAGVEPTGALPGEPQLEVAPNPPLTATTTSPGPNQPASEPPRDKGLYDMRYQPGEGALPPGYADVEAQRNADAKADIERRDADIDALKTRVLSGILAEVPVTLDKHNPDQLRFVAERLAKWRAASDALESV